MLRLPETLRFQTNVAVGPMPTPVSRAFTRVSEVQKLLEEMTSSLLDQLKQALMQLDVSQVKRYCFWTLWTLVASKEGVKMVGKPYALVVWQADGDEFGAQDYETSILLGVRCNF